MGIWLQNSYMLSFAQKFQARGDEVGQNTKHRDTIPLTEVVSWSQLKSPHDWLTFYMDIWQCVKTLYPCSSHQNSWDLWMFIPLKMVLIGIDPYPYGYMDISAGTAGCWIFYLKTQTSSCSADVLWLRLSSCSTFPWAQMTTFGMMAILAIYPIFCLSFAPAISLLSQNFCHFLCCFLDFCCLIMYIAG